ncbi:MAG: cytochrome c oxidase subunit 3 [Bacteroidetes bacterium]|nr:cytochrome c oxidase subunit 3 [Bacteroidota bacterium]MBS1541156.1 cytochrome c oxidase subunit 3 [Bacteroidota bacterium]
MENTVDLRIVEEPKRSLSMDPKKFGMWLFLSTVMMLFMAITSAYIVRQAEGNWVYFELPFSFYVTSFVIVASSVTMQLAYRASKRDRVQQSKLFITLTSVLGVVFLAGQFMGWQQLVASNIYLVGNPSGSFLYVITGLHGLHLISAIAFLFIILAAVFKGNVSSKNMTKMEMCTTYWHFLGGLWLYLFIFLILYR